jgi:hypothetical protein
MHFGNDQWANYVRQTCDSQAQAAMHEHLRAGCSECHEDERLWNEIYVSAQRESEYLPPQDLVTYAMEVFSPLHVMQSSFFGHFAELIFDSALQPLAPGIRTGQAGTRMLLYRSGDIRVDMRMEHRRPNRMNVTGQILDMNGPEQIVSHAPISLVEGSRSLMRTFTNELGEFQLELPTNKDLSVAFEVEGRQVLIPLAVTDSRRWNASE